MKDQQSYIHISIADPTYLSSNWDTSLDIATGGPNLDLLGIQQLDAFPFCKNYADLYFDAKHLGKGLNRG